MLAALFRTLFEVHGIDPIWLLAGSEPDPVRAIEVRLDMTLLEEVIRVVRIGTLVSNYRNRWSVRPEYAACSAPAT